jgi:hypothetical protein
MNKTTRAREWSCLILDPDCAPRRHTVALPPGGRSGDEGAVAAEVGRLLGVPVGREPVLLRSKKTEQMQVWLMDFRDAQNEAEMARARALPRNYAAWELLSPLGYHTIMRERYFRGRVLVTGPQQHLSVSNAVAELLVRRPTGLERAAEEEEEEEEFDSRDDTPSPRDDDYGRAQERIALVKATYGVPTPSSFSFWPDHGRGGAHPGCPH